MRTEDDLREALEYFENAAELNLPASAGSAIGLGTVARRGPGRPRRLGVLTAVAATVAAAIALPLTLSRPAHQVPPAGPLADGAPFTVDLAPGWRYHATYKADTDSSVMLNGPAGQSCFIKGFRRGAFDPATIGGPSATLTVKGSPGYSGVRPAEPPRLAARATFWEYAPDGWALATCSAGRTMPAGLGSPEDLLARQVAAMADFGTPPELQSPVSFDYLPAGFQLTSITRYSGGSQPGSGAPAAGGSIQFELLKGSGPQAPRIGLTLEWPVTRPASPGVQVVLNAKDPKLDGKQLTLVSGSGADLVLGGYTLGVSTELAGLTDDRGEVRKIVESLTIADPRDQATWRPAEVGLP